MAKPQGWWTSHPTILTLCVAAGWDSNGDGIGDFEGIRRHLDYLIDMGISGIRFQQVTRFDDDFEWSGLVAQDWFDVDPIYGSMDDFNRLMKDCQKKDFKIIVMGVPEYLGWHHPDYLAAKKAHAEGLSDPRKDWFLWNDDGTVATVWNHPGPDTSNPGFIKAYLKHIEFWMDKGIAGWDMDAVADWMNLNVDTVRIFTDYIKSRGGFVTSENFTREHDIIRRGGWNAGTGTSRTSLYNETDAICDQDTKNVRAGLGIREELINLGMFPYKSLEGIEKYTHKNSVHTLPMFRLQMAFNAVLPDQVWLVANTLAYPRKEIKRRLQKLDTICYGHLDLDEIERQEAIPDSPYNFVRKIFKLRSQEKALAIGDISEIQTNNRKEIFAALRTSEDGTERAVTVFNFSGGFKDVTLLMDGINIKEVKNYLNEETTRPDGKRQILVRLPPHGFKLYKVIA